ncbi:uncharacterized protein BO80DRAFT_184650 [Aspergillus ibericus CBS 121593]|uniref:Uncharacterized protein n=1 Tax=Aspergillus ibericus CBS 121593 TaxID=1448316 RepID=A0A395GUD3_9EURO|nr:hypothetical protein BO80DRAFT_184650 [Aspergillus ibericus CBS 121593]RAK97713.1 hypothetical protein BO80DRAFT_184650 [Aspergillus ibericus CBS 121593]
MRDRLSTGNRRWDSEFPSPQERHPRRCHSGWLVTLLGYGWMSPERRAGMCLALRSGRTEEASRCRARHGGTGDRVSARATGSDEGSIGAGVGNLVEDFTRIREMLDLVGLNTPELEMKTEIRRYAEHDAAQGP